MAENPLVTQSYVDRTVDEARSDAQRRVSEISEMISEVERSLTYRLGGVEERALEANDVLRQVSAKEWSSLQDSVLGLRSQLTETVERVEKARASSEIEEALADLGKQVAEIKKQVERRPSFETLGRTGGGFFKAKPGVDMVPVGDANGNWKLVDKSTLGGGGSALTVKEDGVVVDATVTAIDFLGADFDVSESPEDEVNVSVSAAIARQSALDAHLTDATDAHDASAISSVPAGTLAATQVQAALDELDSEKVATTRTLTAGSGLSGGGTLAADRTFDVNVDASTIEITRS